MKIDNIIENLDIIEYLQKRNLLKQYKKAKKFIINGYLELADFKLREPKEDGIYYFRINKQFRAFGLVFEELNEENGKTEKNLYIYKIDNHQN